jgi:hypothetical protein
MQPQIKKHDYEVALSFAGEDREHADLLARLLKDAGISVFYDLFERDSLWGKDLIQHLADIYRNKARYCVVFVSKFYRDKKWTNHELRNAQERLFTEGSEYILPIRVDDTELPGLNTTTGYLDLNDIGIEDVADALLHKLGLEGPYDLDVERANWDGSMTTYQGYKMTSYWPQRIEEAQERSWYFVETHLPRIAWGNESHNRRKQMQHCNDCGVLPGQLHVPSCDQEYCPACGDQALACDCNLEARESPAPQ